MQSPSNAEVFDLFTRLAPIYEQLGGMSETHEGFGVGGFYLLSSLVSGQASMLGFRDAFVAVAIVFAVSVIPALLMDNRRPDAIARVSAKGSGIAVAVSRMKNARDRRPDCPATPAVSFPSGPWR